METQKILIVDDEPENLNFLGQILEKFYILIFAHSGKDALEVAMEHKPNLILLDIMMPEMDGFEVCRRLKSTQDTKEIPVIFVTALSEIVNETEGFDVGAIDYITKPIKPEIVKARIKTHLSLEIAHLKIVEQNRTLKEQSQKLFEFGAKKKLQVEKMAAEVAKAMDAITMQQKELGESYTNHVKSLVDIIQTASKNKSSTPELISIIRSNIKNAEDKLAAKGMQLPEKKIKIHSLRPGMIISQEIKDCQGQRLLLNGAMVTEALIKSLLARQRSNQIEENITIIG